MNVYQTTKSYQMVLQRANDYAEEHEGEVNEKLEELLGQLGDDREEALIGLMYDIKNKELDVEAIVTAIKDLNSKLAVAKERVDKMKMLLASSLGEQPLTDGIIKTTKAVSKSLKITGEVPDQYKVTKIIPEKVTTTSDNATIKKQLLNGELVAEWAIIEQRKSVK